MLRFIIVLFTAAVAFTSCKTQSRAIENYIEDVKDSVAIADYIVKEPIIQKNDLLQIQVYSASVDPTVDALYNMPMQQGGAQNPGMNGVLVDAFGDISFPRMGKLHVEGLTKSQLSNLMVSKLQGQLTDPTVIVRFQNFKILVLGEVNSPGLKSIPTENLSLLEALSLAGDVTLFGKKKEVKVLRQTNGKQEVGFVDVTTKEMFNSPYFQLQQNDVVLVEANRYKVRQTEQQRISQQIGFATGIITTIALLITLFR